MSKTTPVRTVIVGCGMIAAGGYQPRCQAYPHRIELVGYYDQDEEPAPQHWQRETEDTSTNHLTKS